MNLDDYEQNIEGFFRGTGIIDREPTPIVRAARLLAIADRLDRAVWNAWTRERARLLASHARTLADELLGGDAEEKVTEWAARESEEWARKIERHRA